MQILEYITAVWAVKQLQKKEEISEAVLQQMLNRLVMLNENTMELERRRDYGNAS